MSVFLVVLPADVPETQHSACHPVVHHQLVCMSPFHQTALPATGHQVVHKLVGQLMLLLVQSITQFIYKTSEKIILFRNVTLALNDL